jgi:hypothetical protein
MSDTAQQALAIAAAPLPPGDAAIERAARALWARDAKRSIGLASSGRAWERVAPEYRHQARAVVAALSEDPES